VEVGKRDNVEAITDLMCQSNEMRGLFKASITIEESPSRENFERFKDVAKKAARDTTKLGSHGGLI
jgi:hypothetical protein